MLRLLLPQKCVQSQDGVTQEVLLVVVVGKAESALPGPEALRKHLTVGNQRFSEALTEALPMRGLRKSLKIIRIMDYRSG
jgi:hypothetical protein